ncbi:MAG TPA: Crp/Fnr family transcriptional regulator [Blastocatellia bacterium]|nr:Crp/Fnr family transcriptional regulator [Blastocatellia bacterium]
MKESRNSTERGGTQREMLVKVVASSIGYLKLEDLIAPGDTGSARLFNRLSRKLRFATGQQIYPQKDGKRMLVVVVEGAMNLFLRDTGKRTFVKRVEKGSIVGEMPSWGQRMLDTHAVAAGRCEVWILDESAATELKRRSLELLLKLQEGNGLTLYQCLGSRVDRFRTFDRRLARFLIDHADEDGIVCGLTHSDIAAALGTHRETVTRAMRSLRRKGWIQSHRGKITLVNRDALREFAS